MRGTRRLSSRKRGWSPPFPSWPLWPLWPLPAVAAGAPRRSTMPNGRRDTGRGHHGAPGSNSRASGPGQRPSRDHLRLAPGGEVGLEPSAVLLARLVPPEHELVVRVGLLPAHLLGRGVGA